MFEAAIVGGGRKSPFDLYDQDGFVIDPFSWSLGLAQEMAHEQELGELSDTHLEVISVVRHSYLSLGALPSATRVCSRLGLHKDSVDGMFGSNLGLWRVAGLPNPGQSYAG